MGASVGFGPDDHRGRRTGDRILRDLARRFESLAEAAAAAQVRSDLYGAVERGELRLYFQPLADIATGSIYGFEGLVRWQHPPRGLMMPDQFISAEETGLIVELGRWVLVEGCCKSRPIWIHRRPPADDDRRTGAPAVAFRSR